MNMMGVLPYSFSRTTSRRCLQLIMMKKIFFAKNHPSRNFSSISATTSTSSTRFPHLNSPTPKDAHELLARMDYREGSVITNYHESLDDDNTKNNKVNNNDDRLVQYNNDWGNKFHGHSSIVVRPQTTTEVSSILKYCYENKLGVVPQAGNTGLVGGSVPIADEVIVSIQKLNTIHNLDETSGILKCDAGVILQDLQQYTMKRNFMVPVDLGAKGSCLIGGNVSTNAGGQYLYRHGSLHANVLGLEVVLPDGTILDLLSSVNLKDNTGYDLKQLFIGAEGTLGIITKVALHCPRLPQERNVAFVACQDYKSVQQLLIMAKDVLGEVLAAFELMDQGILNLVQQDMKIPISMETTTSINTKNENYPFCVLIETQGSNKQHDMEKMEEFLEKAMSSEICIDGVLSQDLTQVHKMWDVRDSCGPVVKSTGYLYKYDISIPIGDFEDIALEMRDRLGQSHPSAIVVSWGHIVDGNLHLNITTPGIFEEDPSLTKRIEPYIFESVIRRGGSISAEHGLGQCKNSYLTIAKDPKALNIMKSIRTMFDPHGIMNPGKYLPDDHRLANHNGTL